MRMPGGHPHIAARVKFHGMRDLTFRCLECGGEACPPWTTYCPLCAAERDAILSVDDENESFLPKFDELIALLGV